mmetsp:Transcript_10404/g.22919  ORF Transcript_10404/g.22919 Transcript_10404/m.22919 type:complete len:828 (-) Transcript_10404:61-2544(-)
MKMPNTISAVMMLSVLLAESNAQTTEPSVQPSSSSYPSTSTSPSATLSLVPSRSAQPSITSSHPPSSSAAPSTTPSTPPSQSMHPSVRPSFSFEPSYLPSNSVHPTIYPSSLSSDKPSFSTDPSSSPSDAPTASQMPSISAEPTASQMPSISAEPTGGPTLSPSYFPTLSPSLSPVAELSSSPSSNPSASPSEQPSASPTAETLSPTLSPSTDPTISPSLAPTLSPSLSPSLSPTMSPTVTPSVVPTLSPSMSPTMSPSLDPTLAPTGFPTSFPIGLPTETPTSDPTLTPTSDPSFGPTEMPTEESPPQPTPPPTPKPSPPPVISPSPATPSPVNQAPELTTNAPTKLGQGMPTSSIKPTPQKVSPGFTQSPSLIGLVCLQPNGSSPESSNAISQQNSAKVTEATVSRAFAGKSGKGSKAGAYQSKTYKTDALMDASSCAYTGRYRTCFQRSSNLSTCDAIVSSKPSIGSGESFISGKMHLALLQDATMITCNKIFQIEKALLTFLADNIGSDDTFEPACVFTSGDAFASQVVPNSGGQFVESTTLEMEVMFIQKNEARRELAIDVVEEEHVTLDVIDPGSLFERRLQSNKCTPLGRAMCCSQTAINSNVGEYCSNLGCDFARCGSGRRPRRSPRELEVESNPDIELSPENAGERRAYSTKSGKSSKGSKASLFAQGKASKASRPVVVKPIEVQVNTCPWYGLMNGDDFTNIVRRYTLFQPQMTRAILDADDTEAVATCSANRFSIDTFGTPSLTCDLFISEDCPNNEDLPVEDDPSVLLSSTKLLSRTRMSETQQVGGVKSAADATKLWSVGFSIVYILFSQMILL